MSAPEDHDYSLPTPLSDKVRLIAAGLIEDCRLAVDYEAKLLDVADEIAVFERREVTPHAGNYVAQSLLDTKGFI